MTLNDLRERAAEVIEPMAALAERSGISPNQISLLSLFFAAWATFFYYLSSEKTTLLYVAALMVLLNAAFDSIDGALARRTGKVESKGDFLDHVIDRYADMFILAGIILAGYVSCLLGLLAVMGVLLTSYIGTQAQALNLGRYYGGIMGRADRLTFIFLATVANAVYSETIAGLQILGWIVILIAITSHITALQRFIHVWRRL
ncbi:MAG: CDP-alcohol phosphatidyltransferase family protein [Methanotrichaceae archaeon]